MTTSLINVKTRPVEYWTNNPSFLYIGRENIWMGLPHSKWNNPFPMKNEGQRKSILTNFLHYIVEPEQKDLIVDLHEIDDKILGCYCVNEYREVKCHGNILIKLRELQKQEKIEQWEEILDWINR